MWWGIDSASFAGRVGSSRSHSPVVPFNSAMVTTHCMCNLCVTLSTLGEKEALHTIVPRKSPHLAKSDTKPRPSPAPDPMRTVSRPQRGNSHASTAQVQVPVGEM